jgi:Protein of unknown function (DUF2752)
MMLSFYSDIILWLEMHLLTCPSKKYLHIDCPGCGLQRSFIALLKGDVVQSFQLYPATPVIVLMFGYLLAHLMFKFKNGARNLTFLFIFCASIILVHYIYKVITHQNF